ncbi:unnamed protein product [Notodromas monacha]|uniref:BEACH domain-containing protein n=1 Tax=Notodromas monacha TaxID=399045 RepID=A0A7R9BRU7_9CRUS|nr:unnamed protein product [Notodromas monacha]CAG0920538.1 unnamed protein product [Notodromas monacha]
MCKKTWKLTKQFLEGPKGPWRAWNIPEQKWKLASHENAWRMRLRMMLNPSFDDHSQASKLRDNQGDYHRCSSDSVLPWGIAQKAVRRKNEAEDDEDEITEDDDSSVPSAPTTTAIQTMLGDHESPARRAGCPGSPMKILLSEDCFLVELMSTVRGKLDVNSSHMHFCDLSPFIEDVGRKDFWIPMNRLREIHLRRYNLRRSAVEFFLTDHSSHLINFPSTKSRNRVFRTLLGVRPPNLLSRSGRPPAHILKSSGLTQKWVNRQISNFQYLMHLNTIAGRTYNDLSQYPVFPWILADYDSGYLNLNDVSAFRDLSKPMGVVNPKNEAEVRQKYETFEDMSGTVPKFHYGTHYSNSAGVLHFLVRVEPFTSLHIDLQSGRRWWVRGEMTGNGDEFGFGLLLLGSVWRRFGNDRQDCWSVGAYECSWNQVANCCSVSIYHRLEHNDFRVVGWYRLVADTSAPNGVHCHFRSVEAVRTSDDASLSCMSASTSSSVVWMMLNPSFDDHSQASKLRDNQGDYHRCSSDSVLPWGIAQKAVRRKNETEDDEDEITEDDDSSVPSAPTTAAIQTMLGDHESPARRAGCPGSPMKILLSEDCFLVELMSTVRGKLDVNSSHMHFCDLSPFIEDVGRKDFWIPMNRLREIHLRRYNLRRSAVEFFLTDHSSHLINFPSTKSRNRVFRTLLGVRPPNLLSRSGRPPAHILKSSGLTQKWVNRQISNFQYLMHLNTIAASCMLLNSVIGHKGTYDRLILSPINLELLHSRKSLDSFGYPHHNPKNEAEVRQKYETFEDMSGWHGFKVMPCVMSLRRPQNVKNHAHLGKCRDV